MLSDKWFKSMKILPDKKNIEINQTQKTLVS